MSKYSKKISLHFEGSNQIPASVSLHHLKYLRVLFINTELTDTRLVGDLLSLRGADKD